jgi:hypothetical protein
LRAVTPVDWHGVETILIVILVMLGVAGVVWAGIAAAKAERERTEALRALAAETGLTFHPERDRGFDARFAQFAEFTQGHSRYACNRLIGTLEIRSRPYETCAGDFQYKVTRSNGKSTTTSTYRISFLLLRPQGVTPPDLLIRSEHILDKIVQAIGFDDIDFESAEFSRKFMVKSSDRRFAYDVIHPRMMEFLLASPRRAIQLRGGWCLLASPSTRWKPEQFREALAFATRFFELWPDFVFQNLLARSGPQPTP